MMGWIGDDPKDLTGRLFVDADFAGNWDPKYLNHLNHPDTVRSRTRYVITYTSCPITWKSKMQTQVALSTTESECISLSTGALLQPSERLWIYNK